MSMPAAWSVGSSPVITCMMRASTYIRGDGGEERDRDTEGEVRIQEGPEEDCVKAKASMRIVCR